MNSKYNLKINAPTFIYKIIYNKYPDFNLVGNTGEHKQKTINNISIDYNIPTNAIIKLNNISSITVRSSCQGYDDIRPSYLIFLPNNQNIEYVKKLVKKLNDNKNIISGYVVGNNNKFRIGVTNKNLWYSENNADEFNKWWNNLPSILIKNL